jgi:hypothetical protein
MSGSSSGNGNGNGNSSGTFTATCRICQRTFTGNTALDAKTKRDFHLFVHWGTKK